LEYNIDDLLSVKLLDVDDTGHLFSLINLNRHILSKWLPWVYSMNTIDDIEKYIKIDKKRYLLKKTINLGLWYANNLIGIVGFDYIDWANKKANMWYWLDNTFWGSGIIHRSCKFLIDYAFYTLEINRIEIRCSSENYKSQAVAERLGFNKEGLCKESEWIYDHYNDLYIYGLISYDWANKNNV